MHCSTLAFLILCNVYNTSLKHLYILLVYFTIILSLLKNVYIFGFNGEVAAIGGYTAPNKLCNVYNTSFKHLYILLVHFTIIHFSIVEL